MCNGGSRSTEGFVRGGGTLSFCFFALGAEYADVV